ncbi:Arabinose operon regulatory protein [Pirellulimonas nuda]|uniref:Arabinose operon regulatory protein n=2 Tax=Pirellulimonas nuda TaxID=2528009 RepID=A0A518DDN1_9BACT|nr:Arabinose operon regulatory protein [Pirellulimonas nuda]
MPVYRETIETPPGQSLRLLRWEKSLAGIRVCTGPHRSAAIVGSGNRWHAHKAFELTLVQTGQGVRFCGDHIGAVDPPELVLIGGDLPHYWSGLDASSGSSVQFEAGPRSTLAAFPEQSALRPLWEGARHGLLFSKQDSAVIGQRLARMPALSPLGRLAELMGVLEQLRVARPRAHSLSSKPFTLGLHAPHSDTISRAIALLVDHFEEPLSVDDVAEAVGLSRTTLCRYFRRYTGRSMVAFLNEVRIDQAQRMLVQTDLSIAQVAIQAGFTNLSHFNRRFRRALGATPREHRRSRGSR